MREWWIDRGATRHLCSKRNVFSKFESVQNRETLFKGSSSMSRIEGSGNHKMTSVKELTMRNVLYVMDIQMNLVSRMALNK